MLKNKELIGEIYTRYKPTQQSRGELRLRVHAPVPVPWYCCNYYHLAPHRRPRLKQENGLVARKVARDLEHSYAPAAGQQVWQI